MPKECPTDGHMCDLVGCQTKPEMCLAIARDLATSFKGYQASRPTDRLKKDDWEEVLAASLNLGVSFAKFEKLVRHYMDSPNQN